MILETGLFADINDFDNICMNVPLLSGGKRGTLMFISVFDVFKIGIAPSHTMRPMVATSYFLREIEERDLRQL
jgi:hypothetical protein